MQVDTLDAIQIPNDETATVAAVARRGDAEAFGSLVKANERTLYRIARTVLSSDQDCADAVQDAVAKAWRKIGSLREPRFFRTWLVRILLNECYRQLRSRKQQAGGEWELAAPPGEPEEELIDLADALAKLPARYRAAIVLYHVEGWSIKEIARSEGVPEGTVKSRLKRARERLAAELRPEEEEA